MALLSQHGADVRFSIARPRGAGGRTACFVALLCIAPLTACTAGPGENAASCEGDQDGDGDDLSGCADPDCHRFEHCRRSAALIPDAGAAGTSAGQGGNAGTRPPVGGIGGAMVSGGQGGTSGHEDEDAGAEHDAGECSCAANELCTDAGCVPIEAPEPIYTVRMLSAQSPRGTLGPPPDGTCVEIACRSGGGSPVSYCPCEPEPYVRVIHISQPAQPDPIESIVLSTKIQGAMLMVTFDADDQADVDLKPGDALRFELWDQNMTVADSLIYTCEPDLHGLTPGPLDCSALSGPLGVEEFWIHATLEQR